MSPQVDLIDIAFQTESLLAIQKAFGQQYIVKKPSSISNKPYSKKLWNQCSTPNNVSTTTTCPPLHSSKHQSKSPPVLHVQYLGQSSSNSSLALSTLWSVSLTKPSFCNICYDPSHLALGRPLLANPHFAHLANIGSVNLQNLPAHYWRKSLNKSQNNWNNVFGGRKYPDSFSSGHQTRVSQTMQDYGATQKN